MLAVTQKSALGSNTTQIGQQLVYQGLSPSDATNMALEMFHSFYPNLREEAISYVMKRTEEYLSQLSEGNIQVPDSRIAISVLQNAAMTEEENIREMYAQLLGHAFNRKYASEVHPSFVNIISQLSSIDAAVFKKIVEINDSIPLARVIFKFDSKYLSEILPHFFCPILAEIFGPFESSVSIENLARLNVFDLFEGRINSYNYNEIKQNPYILERFEYAKKANPTRQLQIEVVSYVIQMNDFGKRLAKICL